MRASDLVAVGAEGVIGGELEAIVFKDPKIAFVIKRCGGKTVLDLGCVMHDPGMHLSRYWLHRAIRAVARSVVGMDLSEPGIADLRCQGYDVVVGDAEHFSFDRKFEVIVAGDLIEHLSNVGSFFESCLGALAPNGCIIIQTPNPWYWRNVVKAVIYTEVSNNPEHTCWFDPRTLRQLTKRFGLNLGEIRYHSRYPRDLYMPLPRGLKHTSWSTELLRSADAVASSPSMQA